MKKVLAMLMAALMVAAMFTRMLLQQARDGDHRRCCCRYR